MKYKLSNGHSVQPPQPLGDGGGRLVWRSAAGIGCGNIYLNDFPLVSTEVSLLANVDAIKEFHIDLPF